MIKDLYFYISFLYYECSNIVLNGGYLEFELEMIVDDEEEFREVQSRFYKEEDFEIECCGISIIVPIKNACMFFIKTENVLTVWITFNVKTFIV